MPGMRTSLTITSAGARARLSSASAPLGRNSISHSLRMQCMARFVASSTNRSSSTNKTRIMLRHPSGRGLSHLPGAGVGADRNPDEECRALAAFGLERERTAVLVDDDAARDGKALTRPFTDLLGGEERIEDLVPRLLGDPGTGVADRDLHRLAYLTRAHDKLAPVSRILDHRGNSVRGVHHQIKHDLIDLTEVALHLWKLGEVRLELGDVLVLIASDRESALDRLIEVRQALIGLVGMREFLHRAHDRRDALESAQSVGERLRQVLHEILQIHALLGGSRFGGELGERVACSPGW